MKEKSDKSKSSGIADSFSRNKEKINKTVSVTKKPEKIEEDIDHKKEEKEIAETKEKERKKVENENKEETKDASTRKNPKKRLKLFHFILLFLMSNSYFAVFETRLN